MVIIDTPPSALLSDAAIVAQYVDGSSVCCPSGLHGNRSDFRWNGNPVWFRSRDQGMYFERCRRESWRIQHIWPQLSCESRNCIIKREGAALYNFMINPAARSGMGRKTWKKVEKILLEQQIEYRAYYTKGQGDARRIAGKVTSGSDPRSARL